MITMIEVQQDIMVIVAGARGGTMTTTNIILAGTEIGMETGMEAGIEVEIGTEIEEDAMVKNGSKSDIR